MKQEKNMTLKILMLITACIYAGCFSVLAQHQSTLFLNAQQKADKSSASRQSVELLKAWKIKSFRYRNLQHKAGEVPPDEVQIKPANKHFFLVIELAFPRGETIVRVQPVTKRSAGSDLSITDLIYTGSLGHRVALTSTLASDASGNQYLPVASTNGTGVYLVEPLGKIKATIFAPGMTDIGFQDDVGFAESGRFVILYEIPNERSGLKLQIGDGEPIVIPVKS
jgi:hypothetical protein